MVTSRRAPSPAPTPAPPTRPRRAAAESAPAALVTRPKKLAALLAERVQRDIAADGWRVGHLLGSEAQLMERYEVSRATLREAVRQLERHGVATMRRGFGGGLTVHEPAHRAAVQALATFLELTHVSPQHLFEAKEVLELRSVNLAILRLQGSHVASMRERLAQIQDTPFDAIEQEARLHADIRRIIAQAAGNPALAVFTQALNRITHKLLPSPAEFRALKGEHLRERELRALQVEALVAGNASAAEQATLEELALSRQAVERSLHRFRRRAGDVEDLAQGAPPHVSPWDAQDKLPHRLAAAIALDISQARLPAGSRVGSEPEVLARFGVSRAVFREAVRLLEGYGIVQMRRGYGGGLIVGHPDPTYTISLVSTYLRHTRMRRSHFLEIFGVLWVAAAPLAAQRASKAQAQSLLDAALALDPAAGVATAMAMLEHFRLLLACAGNPAIQLIGEVVHTLGSSIRLDRPTAETIARNIVMHRDLFRAVLGRDAAMARRTMRRYVEAIEAMYGNDESAHRARIVSPLVAS